MPAARKTAMFDQGACGYCHRPTRTMFQAPSGGGKNTKRQRTKWYVCEAGHKIYRKRG